METIVTEPIIKDKKETKKNSESALVLLNDEHNSFEFVIECLVLYIGKTVEDAMEIAEAVHFTGGCEIMIGSKEKLQPYYEVLRDKGLTVTIEC